MTEDNEDYSYGYEDGYKAGSKELSSSIISDCDIEWINGNPPLNIRTWIIAVYNVPDGLCDPIFVNKFPEGLCDPILVKRFGFDDNDPKWIHLDIPLFIKEIVKWSHIKIKRIE